MTDERVLRLLGKRVRQLRKDRGWTQEDMGRFGFELKYYQRIEYGNRNLSVSTLNKLAKVFGVGIGDLFKTE
jgi:transcriptional regulator with XRE-family HTH domain